VGRYRRRAARRAIEVRIVEGGNLHLYSRTMYHRVPILHKDYQSGAKTPEKVPFALLPVHQEMAR